MVYIVDSLSSSSLGDAEGSDSPESDDTAVMIRSPPARNQVEESRLAQVSITICSSE